MFTVPHLSDQTFDISVQSFWTCQCLQIQRNILSTEYPILAIKCDASGCDERFNVDTSKKQQQPHKNLHVNCYLFLHVCWDTLM